MEKEEVDKDTIEILSKTFKLGIISDTWPGATKQLKLMGIENYFSSLTFSCDLGVFKPDERMYIDALKKMGCKPEDAVFIDDVVINLEGAAKLGITPILIERDIEYSNQLRNDITVTNVLTSQHIDF